MVEPHLSDLALLRLQVEWGADEALEALPIDRLASAATIGPPAARAVPAPTVAPSPGVAARAASVAAACADLASLREALAAFEDCALRETAGHTVFGDGPEDATVMFVTEVPSADDDASGRPLSGRPGILFEAMLGSIGLSRDAIRIACLVPWRPPGGRAPTALEVAACRPFLLAQLRLLPSVTHLVLFGAVAARSVASAEGTLRQLRGTWLDVPVEERSRAVPALVMAPVEMAAADARQKSSTWLDLLKLRRVLDAADGSRFRDV